MLEELDKLAAKVKEVTATVTALRAENQQLRAQLVAASAELEAMNSRVDEATRRLSCSPDEKEALLRSAQLVDSKMQAIREAGKVMGADRIAVMAALQFAHELLNTRGADGVEAGELRRRVRDLVQVCDEALLPQEKLF